MIFSVVCKDLRHLPPPPLICQQNVGRKTNYSKTYHKLLWYLLQNSGQFGPIHRTIHSIVCGVNGEPMIGLVDLMLLLLHILIICSF